MNPYERSMHKALDRVSERLDDACSSRDRFHELWEHTKGERDSYAKLLVESRRAHEATLAALQDAVKEVRDLKHEVEWQASKASDLIRATTRVDKHGNPFHDIEVIHGEQPKVLRNGDHAQSEGGNPVRKAREECGLGLNEAARRADIDPAHLSRAERGEARLSVAALYRVAGIVGLFDLERALAPYVQGWEDAYEVIHGEPKL